MPVGDYTGPKVYTGNGVATVYAYDFRVLAAADLLVTVDGTTKTLTTDYSVSGAGDAGGGNVTFTTAPANTSAIVIDRARAYTRSTDYQRNGSFDEETVDEDFDATIMLAQQLAAISKRSFKAPRSVSTDQALTDAMWAARASRILGFDADGAFNVFDVLDPGELLVTPFIETLVDDADAATARTTLGAAADADVVKLAGAQTLTGAKTFPNTGLKVLDTDASHALALVPGANLTADRTLTVHTPDADSAIGVPVRMAAVSLASGTSKTVTGFPSWVTEVMIGVRLASTDGTNPLTVRLGDAGGIETANYDGTAQPNGGSAVSNTANFAVTGAIVAAGIYSGTIRLWRGDGHTWFVASTISRTDGTQIVHHGSGSKVLSDTLTQFDIAAGGNNFDNASGELHVTYR